jgi:hypothetical protein
VPPNSDHLTIYPKIFLHPYRPAVEMLEPHSDFTSQRARHLTVQVKERTESLPELGATCVHQAHYER